jgi:hypothetical protein
MRVQIKNTVHVHDSHDISLYRRDIEENEGYRKSSFDSNCTPNIPVASIDLK